MKNITDNYVHAYVKTEYLKITVQVSFTAIKESEVHELLTCCNWKYCYYNVNVIYKIDISITIISDQFFFI
jgi:hypothetical protein